MVYRSPGLADRIIDKVFDRTGREVAVETAKCEQVVPPGLANTLASGAGGRLTVALGAFVSGGELTLINPGEQVTLRWKATRTGVFVYHCAPGGPMIRYHGSS